MSRQADEYRDVLDGLAEALARHCKEWGADSVSVHAYVTDYGTYTGGTVTGGGEVLYGFSQQEHGGDAE